MGAWFECVTIHAWYWMQTWRVASRAGEPMGARRSGGGVLLPPWSEDMLAAACLHLPPELLFPRRLGLDLGIDTNLALGGCRQ